MAAAYNDIFGCGVLEQVARDTEAAATLSILSKRPALVLTPSAPKYKKQRLSFLSDVDTDADINADVSEEPRILAEGTTGTTFNSTTTERQEVEFELQKIDAYKEKTQQMKRRIAYLKLQHQL